MPATPPPHVLAGPAATRGGRACSPRPSTSSSAADLIGLLRPGQWPKNLVVVPLALLDAPVWTVGTVSRAAAAVLAFTLASSLVYVVNDIADRTRDRAHPVKRQRAIAAGRVRVPAAVALALVLAGLLAAVISLGPPGHWWPLLAYVALGTAYSAKLKHVPLLDVFVVATGFVLRVVQGYLITGVEVASWLVLCVLALCLVLILGKRRHELAVAGAAHRPALHSYTTAFVDQVLVLCAGMTVLTYLLYLQTEATLGTAALLSAPCALFAMFRYLQVVLVHRSGGNPVRVLLHDRAMVANSVVWAALIAGPLLATRAR